MDGDRSVVPPDEDLVRAVAAGSQESLAILYDRYAESLYRLAVRLTNDRASAEEIVQETFLALWNRAELFEPASGSLATWLRVIARNRALDRLRAAARRPRAAGPLSDPLSDGVAFETGGASGAGRGSGPVADPAASPERAIELAELRSILRDALAEMPDPERRVILLAYQDGLSQSEIADRLGWPLGTVKTRTRRALQRLRAALAGVGFVVGDSSAPGQAEPARPELDPALRTAAGADRAAAPAAGGTGVDPAVEPEVQAAVDPDAEPGAEPAVDPDPEPGAELAVELDAEPEVQAAVDPDAERGAEPAVPVDGTGIAGQPRRPKPAGEASER